MIIDETLQDYARYEGQTVKLTLSKNWNYLICLLVQEPQKRKNKPPPPQINKNCLHKEIHSDLFTYSYI